MTVEEFALPLKRLTLTSTVMLVSQPNISTTFTQIECLPGLP